MEGSTELFEFARQIATPEYVAAKVQGIEASQHVAEVVFAASICVAAVCVVALLVAYLLERKGVVEDSFTAQTIMGLLLILCAVALIVSVIFLVTAPSNLAIWQNNPVTKVARSIMRAL